ncbi:MAG: transposase [candidate division WOR-3 bacterium]
MSFIRYKKFGRQEYAYEVVSVWDKALKKPRQKTKYLGIVIDKRKKIFKKGKAKDGKEKLILDFGDTYLIYQFLKRIKFLPIVEKIFKGETNYLLALLFYRLCNPSAMKYARVWYEGNFAKILFRDVEISSQRVSESLEAFGDEYLQRQFFSAYIGMLKNLQKGIIIDTTALPNQIHCSLSVWGYHDESVDKQIKFLFVIEKNSSLPLFFRYLPGNVVDVSSLKITLEELKRYGISWGFVLIDAGFFSEENIKELYKGRLPFLTRLPSSRKLYRRLIRNEVRDLERVKHAVRYGKRVLFIKRKRVYLFGSEVYAYIILDPERKGREIKKMLLKVMDESFIEDEREIEYELMRKGVMVLISSFKISEDEVVPLYYMREMAEKLFRFSKDDLNLIPLRVHKEATLRGYLFLLFVVLIVFVFLKKEIGTEYTVEEVLLTMRNLKCKVYEDDILVQEMTKEQKEIVEKLKILVPKSLGI